MHSEPQRTTPSGLDSNRSVSDSDSKEFLGGTECCVGYSSHRDPLGKWLTRVALPAQKLDWPLYLGGWPYLLLAAAAYTALVGYKCRTLPSSPRDLRRRHPHIDFTMRNPDRVDCRLNGVSQAPSLSLIGSIPITLRMALHAQNEALLYNILAPCQLCVHLVYKGVGTPCQCDSGLQHVWIAPPLNKGMLDFPTALQFFFCVPESRVNLSSLEQLQHSNLSDSEFKKLVIRMLKELSKDLTSIKKIKSEMKDTLIEIKNKNLKK